MYTYIKTKRNDHGSFSLLSLATTEAEEPPATGRRTARPPVAPAEDPGRETQDPSPSITRLVRYHFRKLLGDWIPSPPTRPLLRAIRSQSPAAASEAVLFNPISSTDQLIMASVLAGNICRMPLVVGRFAFLSRMFFHLFFAPLCKCYFFCGRLTLSVRIAFRSS